MKSVGIPVWLCIGVLLLSIQHATAQNPTPLILEPLLPDTIRPDASGFTLTVNGTGFVSGAVVTWNGSARMTTFVNKSRVTASILSSDVAHQGTAAITVVNPGPGGGVSNAALFPISLPVNFLVSASAFAAGAGPRGIATGDFNNDGKLDLIVPDTANGNVSILLGNGDGTLQAPLSYAVGQGNSSQFFQVAVGDFNQDGKLDFAVSDYQDNYVNVFLGNGDGTFQPGVIHAAAQNPTSVAVADLKGNGKLDLVVSDQNCGSSCGPGLISLLFGNGDGTFQPHIDINAGQDPNWVTVGDFNRDGKLDLAVVNGNRGGPSELLILLGNGDGTFQAPARYALNTNGASLVTADINGDGNLDIAVVDGIGVVSVFLGNGNGTFRSRMDYATACNWGVAAIGDFNEDGHLDIATANACTPYSVSVLLGKGDGTFQPQIQVPTGAFPQGVVAGDFNMDGRLDLATPNLNDNTVSVLLQNGSVSLAPPTLSFGPRLLGSAPSKTVTLTNVGSTAFTISSISVSGANAADFVQTHTCGSSLAANAHCTITVTFTPTRVGPRTASLVVTDSAPGSPHSVPLGGIGVISGPDATLTPTSLSFPVQLVGTTSSAQSLTLTNYGTAALAINSIAATGDFHEIESCGSSLAVLTNCTISVTFQPTGAGTRTGALSVADNAPGTPQKVSLSGTGTVVLLNPTSLNFGVHTVGTTASQATTLTNVGKTTVSITGIALTGAVDEFSQTNDCLPSVAAGKSCTVTVTFKPSEAGGDSASVVISDNGGGSPQSVPLSGAGCVFINHRCKTAISRVARSALAASAAVVAPAPTGPSKIGTRVIHLADARRHDPYLKNDAARELLVRFWYPTSDSAPCNPAPYASPKVWSYFAALAGQHLPEVSSNSCAEALLADKAYPVIVFTPGYTGTFTDYTFLFEDLASRGYVVASIDHPYEATAVEFPDGRFVPSLVGSHIDNSWRTDEKTLSLALSTRSLDIRFVVDELERLNTTAGTPFTGRLDTSRLALMGHSLGGAATLTGLQRDSRFKAGVVLDGVFPDATPVQTDKALLIVAAGREQWSEQECRLWSAMKGPRLAVNLKGAEHMAPSDAVWLARGAVKTGAMGPDKTIAAVRDYVAAFFNAYLSAGSADFLLTAPPSRPEGIAVTLPGQSLCQEDGNGNINPGAEHH